MGDMSSPKQKTISLKRTADEAEVVGEPSAATAPAPTAATTVDTSTISTALIPFKPFKSPIPESKKKSLVPPNSEVKKKSAAQSLANLFQSQSGSFDSNASAESPNDLVADLMSASDGGGDGKPADATDAATDAAMDTGYTAAGGDTEEPKATNESYEVGFSSPRKKSRTSKSPPPTVAPEEKLPVFPPAVLVPPATAAELGAMAAAAVAAAAEAAATATAGNNGNDHDPPEVVCASTPQRVATTGNIGGGPQSTPQRVAVVMATAGDNVNAPPKLSASTPQRVAGASVLASLGFSTQKKEDVGGSGKLPPLPPIMEPMAETIATSIVEPMAVEIPMSIGTVQHDYLLQNLVHATKVTSPLQIPGKGKGFTPASSLGAAVAAIAPLPPLRSKSRKEKSLGVLCQNFMDLFRDAPPNRNNNGTVIDICQVAEHLVVKRRRIYDVINILESIDIVCRVKKNTYRWHGKDDLPRFFAELQKEGLQERANQQAAMAVAAAVAATGGGGEESKLQLQQQQLLSAVKTKGMAQTCQKLIQIFLVSGRTDIGLTDAAEEVLGPLSPDEEANSQKAMKTKVRRMYDIANVLQSIGILQKENVGSTSLQNKPSFRWVYHILPCDMAIYLKSSQPFPPQLDMGNAALASVVAGTPGVVPPPPVMDVVTFSAAWSGAMAGGNITAASPGTAPLVQPPHDVTAPLVQPPHVMATLVQPPPVTATLVQPLPLMNVVQPPPLMNVVQPPPLMDVVAPAAGSGTAGGNSTVAAPATSEPGTAVSGTASGLAPVTPEEVASGTPGTPVGVGDIAQV